MPNTVVRKKGFCTTALPRAYKCTEARTDLFLRFPLPRLNRQVHLLGQRSALRGIDLHSVLHPL
jgi:hypothetical protein